MTAGERSGGSDREGHVLAARWSIERLRRPAASELVWLGYAKPEVLSFECLACGAGGSKQGVLRAEGRTLYICGACASHQMHPPELPELEVSDFARRLLLEAGLDLRTAAAVAARALAGLEGGRLVDLGCGCGLVVDMVRRQPGWSACGVDPGPLATLGAEALGVALARGEAETAQAMLAAAACDVLLCRGMLDRSADPLAVLRIMAALAPEARWLLGVADAERLYTATDGVTIRELARARRLIPSAVGLRRLFARAGLRPPAIRRSGDMLWVERAAVTPKPQAEAAVLDRYIEGRMRDWPQEASAAMGLQVAALEHAVARAAAANGDWSRPRALLARLMPALAAAGEAARAADATDIESLFRKAPACSSTLLLQAGLLHLGSAGPSMQALMCFELAALLAGRVAALSPSLPHAEAERHWEARFHAAVVTRALGDTARAVAALRALVADAQRGAMPSAAWAARAQSETEAMLAAPPAPAEATPPAGDMPAAPQAVAAATARPAKAPARRPRKADE